MKLKQILKLYLLNSQAYENIIKNTSSNFLTDFNLIQITSHLKKTLYTVFEYHQAHKKILFVGLPTKLELKINKLTHHTAVDSNFELRGVISNNFKMVNFIKVENKLFSKVFTKSLIPKLSKRPDLIVFLLHEKKQHAITESNIAKIPVISFASIRCLKTNVNKKFNNLEDSSQKLVSTFNKSLFFLGLNFLFKRIKKNKTF